MTGSICRAASIFLLCGSLLCTGAHAQQQRTTTPDGEPTARENRVDLRPRFEKGQQLRYTLELQNTATAVQPGLPHQRPGQRPQQQPDQRSTVEFGLILRTTDVTREGEATVDMVLETVKLKLDAHGMEIEFDSTAPAGSQDEMIAMVMQSVVGTTMTLTVDRTGNIKRITGGEGLAALGQAGIPGAGGGAGGAQQLFGQIFTVKSGSGFATAGESWETEDVINSGPLGRFRMNSHHTLTRMHGRDALITMRGRTELDSEGADTGQVTIREANYSGNYTWDTAAGSLKQLNTSMTVRADVKLGEETTEMRNESAVKITRGR